MTDSLWVYGDASALVKLVSEEAESPALRAFLQGRGAVISSAIVAVEIRRAAARQPAVDGAAVLRFVNDLELIAFDEAIANAAAAIHPPLIRSLDAIHLASALALGSDLDVLVTYDGRMQEAAIALGLPVAAPA